MQLHQVYLAIGVLLVGLEIFVPGFIMAPLGIGALVAAAVAFATDSRLAHLFSFTTAGLVTFLLVSKWNRIRVARFANERARDPIGLVGQIGTLVEPCVSPSQPGRIRIYSDTWDVLWPDQDDASQKARMELAVGARVRVTRVVGNRVDVEPLP